MAIRCDDKRPPILLIPPPIHPFEHTCFFTRVEAQAPSLFPEEGFHSLAEGFADEVLRFAILVPVEALVLG